MSHEDPPSSRRPDAAGSGSGSASENDEPPPSRERAREGPGAPEHASPRVTRGPGVSREAIAAFLCLPSTRKMLFKRVYDAIKSAYRRQEAEDFVDDVAVACLASLTPPPREDAIQAWMHGVATNVLGDANRKHFRRKRYRADGLDPEDAAENGEVQREEGEPKEWMIMPWAMRAVGGDAKDAETLWILRFKARRRLTWAEVAKARREAGEEDESEEALKKRVQRFVARYKPLRRRYLLQMGLLTLALLVAIVALARVLVGLVTAPPAPPPAVHEPSIRRDARAVPFPRPDPRPSPSVPTAPSSDRPVFDPAGPGPKQPAASPLAPEGGQERLK